MICKYSDRCLNYSHTNTLCNSEESTNCGIHQEIGRIENIDTGKQHPKTPVTIAA